MLVDADDVCVHYGATVALAPTTFRLLAVRRWRWSDRTAAARPPCCPPIAGLVRPAAGTIRVDGTVAMVTQSPHHHRWMPLTVDEVLRMGRYPARGLIGRLRADDKAIIADAAEMLEVRHLRRRPFGELSGGQRQRVLVAQAVAASPTSCCSTSRSRVSTFRASCGSSR